MKFFIDTANLDQIKEAQQLGILDGVTTNPSLMAKEGITGEKNIIDHYLRICEIVDGDVSAEVISVDYDGIIKEGEALATLHDQIVIKVPMIEEGVKAIRYFSDKGLKTNCTLVFSSGQALLAAKAGATYVSPFIGRLDDISTDGLDLISDIRDIYDNYAYETQILAASIRHTMHIIDCAKIGADVLTSYNAGQPGQPASKPASAYGPEQNVQDFPSASPAKRKSSPAMGLSRLCGSYPQIAPATKRATNPRAIVTITTAIWLCPNILRKTSASRAYPIIPISSIAIGTEAQNGRPI